MRKPNSITFTGVDDRTNLTRLDAIATRWPGIEWGILFSPANRDARYPSKQGVAEMLCVTGKKAAHLCGQFAVDAADMNIPEGVPLEKFDRVQLNRKGAKRDAFAALSWNYGVEIILQTQDETFPTDERCSFLFDASGGTGRFPTKVPPLVPGKRVGYAGGMGPDTVAQYLSLIDGAPDVEFWIDMEERVRTNGWFDLDKVEHVCEIVFG